MQNKDEQLDEVLFRLEALLFKQQALGKEIEALRDEVKKMSPQEESFSTPVRESNTPIFPPLPHHRDAPVTKKQPASFANQFKKEHLIKSDFEKFIGQNLISKIGILILVIGVGIGAKLAIEKDLISPLTRIILGYVAGICLLGLSIKLKAKYLGFSAVLLSGAMSILYFITFAAYNYYELIHQFLAFGMMVVFTGFTVFAALKYNKPIIAHIGLVGAYAIPFLLSNRTGNVTVLFSYIAIINTGILIISFSRYWKSLFYTAFICTWIIFTGWLLGSAHPNNFEIISILFGSINFFTFYLTSLAYKTIKSETFEAGDVTILLLNSFIFYGIGIYSLNNTTYGENLLGLFTLANALVHFLVSLIIYKRKMADRKLLYFLFALVITFITIAVPVQLQGSWITIFWSIEAGILFYFAKKKNVPVFEKLTLALVYLAFFSFLQDGFLTSSFYLLDNYKEIKPFLNVRFLSSCLFISSFLWMYMVGRKAPATTTILQQILAKSIAVFVIAVTYYAFNRELSLIFDNLLVQSKINVSPQSATPYFVYNENYARFGKIASYCYTLFFASVLTFINVRKIKSKDLAVVNVAINILAIVAFLTYGLYVLSELRPTYLAQSEKYFISGKMNIVVRYISYLFFVALISQCYQLSKSMLFKVKLKKAFDYLLYTAVLWLLSSELLHLLALNGLRTGYKLGMSILWGAYALTLIAIGIWKGKKYLRIGAIVLFAITLVKLFVYDLSALNTISKTIVFVSLGVLLLVISFLYNKYKQLIFDDVETKH